MAVNSINTSPQGSGVSGANENQPLNQLGTPVSASIEIPVGTQNNAQQPNQLPLTADNLGIHNIFDGSSLSSGTLSDLGSEWGEDNNLLQPIQGPLTADNLLAHNLENGSNLGNNTPSDVVSEHIYVDFEEFMMGNQDVDLENGFDLGDNAPSDAGSEHSDFGFEDFMIENPEFYIYDENSNNLPQ